MPSVLDIRIDKAIAAISAPGSAAALSFVEHYGVQVPVVAAAPPNLALYFQHFCTQHAATEFIVSGTERLTFSDTYKAAQRVAEALVNGWGVKKGDRIGLAMRNAPSWIVLYMGVIMAGGCATLLNGWWQGQELADGIDTVGATLVLADPQRAQRLNDVSYAGTAQIISLDIGQSLDAALAPLLAKAGDKNIALPELSGDDLATILFTSGSTGQSKGAYSTHHAVVQGIFTYIIQAMVTLQLGTEDGTISANPPQPSALLSVPLFHVTGEIPILLVSFAVGRKLVMMPKWDVVTAMELIEREKITSFTGVPLMSFELISHPDRHKYDLSTLQGLSGGGAPRPLEHVKRITDEMPHAPPALGYGLTETNAVGAGNFGQNYQEKPNSTGRAYAPMVEIAILDDAGARVAQGERGEICIRSAALFSGYWNREEDSRACMTADGFFRSGDIGYLDADDYIYIVDRKKDIIIRGGENISCHEVEAALYEYPGVAEACVFGLPDERLGELVGAVIHFHPGQQASADEVLSEMRDRIAGFKVPHRLWIHHDPLPRLGTEKIDKVSLRAQYQAEWTREVTA
jgi:long-chain acyl-CoA synthetase